MNSISFFAGLALVLLSALAWGFQEPDHDSAEPSIEPTTWEYKVVGLAEIHSKTLEYLKEAWEGDDGTSGLLSLPGRADAKMAQKREDILNELGREGWELVDHDVHTLILKRPLR